MPLKKSISIPFFLVSVLVVTEQVRAQYGPNDVSITMTAAEERIDYGSPVILKMNASLNKPYIAGHTGKPGRTYKLDGLRLQVQNAQTGQQSTVIFRLPVRFYARDNKGLEYSATEVMMWDVYKERKKLYTNTIFGSPGAYSLTLTRRRETVSNTVQVVLQPSEAGEKALSLLADPNDIVFLVLGLFGSEKPISTLKQVARECEGTVLSKWASARLGITYFKEFEEEYSSSAKLTASVEKGLSEEPLFGMADKYLTLGSELPYEFPIRADVLSGLAHIEHMRGNHQKAVMLLGELADKNPESEDGRKAPGWRKEILAELEEGTPGEFEENTERQVGTARVLLPRFLAVAVPVGVGVVAAGIVLTILLKRKAGRSTK
jgi:hypothetical protein